MACAIRSKILVLLLLCLCINLAVADIWPIHLHRRDGPPATTTTDASASPSQTGGNSGGKDGGEITSASTNATVTAGSNSTSSTNSASTTQTEASITAITSNINGPAPTASLNFSGFNSSLTPNTLPLQPEITPGLAVAGVFLILSGVVYTLVGIKNKWLHTYLSAAYLASLAVTVLILYVMNPPVSNSIQGAYVVAIVMTGLVLGGASIIFTEMTEGLGCLLGGFCFSMWLLVLKPGGLLNTTSGKAIFIAAFTLAAFSTSFSHYTRPYGLIIFVSFGGATAVVLGIDCFSRAGLKEFWAYLWNLNSNLFPLGATSYPVTKGIRVEIAATIIIFLAGILSQSRLWKLIKERRENRAAERLQDERNIEQEEENVGKRIEHANAAERNQWEAVYGDQDATKATPRDSGIADMESQKKGPTSEVTSIRPSGENEIEMSEMPSPTLANGAGLVMMNNGQDGGPVTVRVARDVEPALEFDENGKPVETPANRSSRISARSTLAEEEKVWVVGADGEARLERRPSKRNSKRSSNPLVTKSPDVVALPFKVPEGETVDDDRSSVATFADEEQTGQKRLSTRLSQVLMRKVSQRSHRSSKRFSTGGGQSTEDLFIPQGSDEDRASSIAATMDGLSDDEDMRSLRSYLHQAPDTDQSTREPDESSAQPMEATQPELASASASEPTVKLVVSDAQVKSRPTSAATVATVATAILEPEVTVEGLKAEEPVVQQLLTSSTEPKAEKVQGKELLEEKNKPTPSVVSQVESKPASLSKDLLPASLSKVVMSYRTNEWAKHLSNAEAPEVDEPKLAEYPVQRLETVSEVAAPVNVDELQQTAENGAPLPASRTTSQMSNHALPLTRSSSAQSKYPSPEIANGSQLYGMLSRSSSQQSLPSQLAQQSLNRTLGYRNSSTPAIPQQIVESPIEENFPSIPPDSSNKFSPPNFPYGSTNTLIGKRDNILRGKHSYYNNPSALSSTPEFPSQFPSQFPTQPYSAQHNSTPASGAGSDAGSIYNYPNHSSPVIDEDNMSLSARRELIRQSSLQQISSPIASHLQQTPINFDSHQPRRQSTLPAPIVREQQLASWRASVQQDLRSGIVPKNTIERQRSALWHERQAEDQRKAMEERMRLQRDSAFDERMRRGDMLDAHREALRKMQASANKHATSQS